MNEPLMQYIRYSSDEEETLKYTGETAAGYDEKRAKSDKWLVEQEIIEKMLDDLPFGDWVLDAPIGTGRFIPFYERKGFVVRGLDLSDEMIELAKAKVTKPEKTYFANGNVMNTGLKADSVDASVMCRLTRWLSQEECMIAAAELARVTRKRIIITSRVSNTEHARPISLFEEAMPKWELYQNVRGYCDEYRVLEFRPKT